MILKTWLEQHGIEPPGPEVTETITLRNADLSNYAPLLIIILGSSGNTKTDLILRLWLWIMSLRLYLLCRS